MADKNPRFTERTLKDGTKVRVPTGKDVPNGAGGSKWQPYTEEEIQGLVDQHQKLADKKLEDERKAAQKQRDLDDQRADRATAAQERTSGKNPSATAESVKAGREEAAKTATSGYTGASGTAADGTAEEDDPFSKFSLDSEVITGSKSVYGPSDLSPHKQDETKSLRDIFKDLQSGGGDRVSQIQQQLKDAGYSVEVTGILDGATEKAYGDVVGTAAEYQHSGNKLTPDEVLTSMAAAGKKSASKAAHKSTTDTSTSVQLTDPKTARATLVDAMKQKLGREPTNTEIAQFTSALNGYEQGSPTVQTTTQTSDTDENGNTTTSSNSTQSGSAPSASAFAGGYIQDNHGQEADSINHLNWYNVALQALGNNGINTGLPT